MYLPPQQIATSHNYRTMDHCNREVQLSDLDLSIGTRCRSSLIDLEEEALTQREVTEFLG